MVKKKVEIFELNKRRLLIEPKNPKLSQRAQCELLGLHRSGLYYEPRSPSKEDLMLMSAIDKEYLKHPYYGRRRMTIGMQKLGFLVGQKRVRNLSKIN